MTNWLLMSCCFVFVLSGTSWFAGSVWPFELITHFTPHIALLALGLAGAALWTGAWGGAALSVLAFALAASALTGVAAVPVTANDKPGLTVVWANVWKRTLAADQTLAYAKARGADIVIFGESPYDGSALAAAGGPDYPYTYDLARDVPGLRSKITILSRLPMIDPAALMPPDNEQRPMIEFAVETATARIVIGAVHAFVPAHRRRLAQRDVNIAFAAERFRGRYLLVGDFNATMWTPAMRESGLRRVGHPLFESTWITAWPIFGLAIDHAFPSDGLRVSHYEVGPFLGSDHRAILVRVHADE